VRGRDAQGALAEVRVYPDASPALNVAFDVTPARLVTGLITERGVVPATRDGLARAFARVATSA
jgi:methylthioribose-1-phosphate isomerase